MLGPPSLCTAALASEAGKAGPALSSSFSGEKVRLKPAVACACAGKSIQTVGAVQRDGSGSQGEKPWDTQRALFSSSVESATEMSAVATDYPVSKGKGGLFGYSQGTDSEEEYEEDGEMLRVDNQSVDDEVELAIASLGIPEAVVDALAKRGITQLFPIQVNFKSPLVIT